MEAEAEAEAGVKDRGGIGGSRCGFWGRGGGRARCGIAMRIWGEGCEVWDSDADIGGVNFWDSGWLVGCMCARHGGFVQTGLGESGNV